MKDYDLIDIESKIYSDLSDSCIMDQEATDFIDKNLEQAPEFGEETISEIYENLTLFTDTITSHPEQDSAEFLKHVQSVIKNVNLMSIKEGYYNSFLARFTYVFTFKSGKMLSRHQKNLQQLEKFHAGIFDARANVQTLFLSMHAFLTSYIHLLEKVDRKIVLGKCIIEKLRNEKKQKDKVSAKTVMKQRVFALELEKNIPMQIITGLHVIEGLYNEYFTIFDEQLYPNFTQFVQKYRQNICARLQQMKNPKLKEHLRAFEEQELEELFSFYHQILSALSSLIIIDEDLKEKISDMQEQVNYLNK